MTVALVLHRADGAPIRWESSDRVAKFYVVQSVQA